MKAVRYHGIKDVRVEEIEKPSLKPDEVMVKVSFAGICGSDLHIYRKGMFIVNIPETMGHEFVGVVEEIGQAVRNFKIGDLVVGDPRVPCERCTSCKKGSYNTCSGLGFLGEVSQGCFTEYIAVKQTKLIIVPATEDIKLVGLAEPLAVALHICEIADFNTKDEVAIVGTGPIGLLTIIVAKTLYGVKSITAIDLSEERLKLAVTAGATLTWKNFDSNPGKEFGKIVEAAGVQSTFNNALSRLSDHGSLYMVSIFEKDITIDPNIIVSKEIKIVGCNVYTTEELQKATELIATKQIDVGFLITNEFSLEEGKNAFELLNSDDKTVAKIIFRP
ncbi:Sorbitol dehydrogenase [Sporomusa silvacetica DSM 10669]|uniref:Sorbitol dehydrogenase n=1 Tax=Sporomusa silvacetica DSM 10669 TaxID=1123289 RepID=A0ABZ3INQ9_9FIRM|nr:sorbitol dehydrogenase [Sporomusa silvacetica DSM 10669]